MNFKYKIVFPILILLAVLLPLDKAFGLPPRTYNTTSLSNTSIQQGSGPITMGGDFRQIASSPVCVPVPEGTVPRAHNITDILNIRYEVWEVGGGYMNIGRGLVSGQDWGLVFPGVQTNCGEPFWEAYNNEANTYRFNRDYFQIPVQTLPPGDYEIRLIGQNTNCMDRNDPFNCSTESFNDTHPSFAFTIVPSSSTTGTIYVNSNLYTEWTMSGAQSFGGSGTTATYSDKPAGTYTASVDNIACYSKSVAPSAQQTLAAGGSITYTITYTWVGCDTPPVPGCTDPTAINYNASATQDDGSCEYEEDIPGCTDPNATNYDPDATEDDGSCTYPPETPVCTPSSQNVQANSSASLSASGGNSGPYSWSAPGGSPSSGNTPNFSVTYSTTGTKTITVTRGGESSQCTVVVTTAVACSPFGHDDCADWVSGTVNGVYYDWSSGPASITLPAGTYTASMTYRNTSNNTTWTCCGVGSINDSDGYKVGSQNAQDNTIWGLARIAMSGVGPAGTKTVNFNVTTPSAPGTYNFQWQMVREFQRWFGQASRNMQIVVENTPVLTTAIGTGSGTITGTGISCPGDCSESYPLNTSVTLGANPSSGYQFSGWTGACLSYGATPSCTLTMDGSKVVTANFQLIPPPFNYSLSNSGTSSATKGSGNVYTTNTITKALTSGTTQAVSLTLSGVPSGVSYSIAQGTCSPTCTSVITFTIAPSAPVGNHGITVTGSPLSKTTSFTLAIAGAPMSVTCSVSNNATLVGQPVTWTGSLSGGTAPYTYSWTGTNISAPLPTTNPFTKTYTTIGPKVARLAVTDSDGLQGTCQDVSVQVNFNPNFEEF